MSQTRHGDRRGSTAASVLLVQDEAPSREEVRRHLALAGFDVTGIDEGTRALHVARSTRFDLVILDVMLPGVDGLTLCRALRREGANMGTAILILTAKDAESDKVLGLESGADDYMTTPFSTRELVARTRALLRRHMKVRDAPDASRQIVRGDVMLDCARRRAIARRRPVELTNHEFGLLRVLLTNPGIVFSRAALIARVWGHDTCATERTVDTAISRLRRKIEANPRDPALILTAWGVGYKCVDAD